MKLKKLLLAALLYSTSLSAQDNNYFLSQPSLTPDGQTVVFCYEGDLWKAKLSDGQAVRLTAMKGYETNPRVSPDGKWIAFTGRQFGNADVYVMPVSGGEVKRLTWYSGNDEVSSWSWDSKTIYFTSARLSRQSSYKVTINGGTAVPVFPRHFFLNDHNVFEHPTSHALFYNDTWESSNQVHRKRYKGPYNPDIQSYDPATKKYVRYTNWVGKDFGATLDKHGNIYFISDSTNGEYNLYTFQNSKRVALTDFGTSIKNEMVNAEGGKVVFEKDYQLWVYDVESKKAARLNISILRNNVLLESMDFNVKDKISSFDVSPDGKKLAFISRGRLFVSDIEGKFAEELDAESTERKSEVKWMADNRTLLFNQTDDGYKNWFTIAADKTGKVNQLTDGRKNDRFISLNKKRTKGVYISGRDEICIMDLKTYEHSVIVKDEIWGIESGSVGFSPDGEYVVYSAYRNFEQDVFIHHIKNNKTTNLTKTGISEFSPIWSPDGRYIYFSSSRLKPSYPMGPSNPHIYRIPLQKFDSSYYSDRFNDLFVADSVKKKDTAGARIVTTVDTNHIMDRIELIGPGHSSEDLVEVIEKDGVTTVLYTVTQEEDKPVLYKTELKKFESPKTEKFSNASGDNMSIAESGGKYYLLLNGNISKLNVGDGKADPISISKVFRKNLAGEFSQIFHEAWAQVQENFYDEHFHGINWPETKKRYEKYVPYGNNRGDLRTLVNDMLGELNSSHQGFSSSGDDEKIGNSEATAETGIIFEETNPYKVKYIVNGSAADKVNVNIKPGDVLTAVNGVAVDPAVDRYYYFTKPSMDKELTLTFSRDGKQVTAIIHPQGSISDDLYNEWIDNNKSAVDEKSNNRIAYAVMKNMGQGEFEKFFVKMTQELAGKDGLILDLRYNTGGNVHDEVLQFLSQRSYLQWRYREGSYTKQPNFAPSDKPIVLLINEQSLSDAEMTAQGFKALKLGTIVGNETYHWIIFTSGVGMVDGSTVRMPAWGCYTLDGKNLEKTGVAPDIKVINTFEDKINNKDPQLDAAVSEILKQR
jgi:tricorn protease